MARLLAIAAAVVLAAACTVRADPAAPGGGGGDRPSRVRVRVGELVGFSADWDAAPPIRWRLDGAPVGDGATWAFTPGVEDVGRHVVTADAGGPAGPVRRRWDVRVTPPRLPRVVAAAPTADHVVVDAGREFTMRFAARPVGGETVRVRWTVDGVAAGEGEKLRWRVDAPAVVRVRALGTSSLGAAVGREWRVEVRPTTTTSTVTTTSSSSTARPGDAATPEPVAPLGPLPPADERGATPPAEPEPTTSTTATSTTIPPPPPPTPSASSVEDEVRGLLDRYAAAWRNRDAAELRRLGQIASDAQVADLERYFARVRDLDVEVRVVEVRPEGDVATVRFTRRDRFRDPAGRLVTQESPLIEKRVVRTADGVRFVPSGR
jgi:hypothetical protein